MGHGSRSASVLPARVQASVRLVLAIELDDLVVHRAQHHRITVYILFVALLLAVGHIQERALDDGPAVDIALQRRRALDPSHRAVASHETIREADGRRPGLERRNRLGMQLIVVIVDGYDLTARRPSTICSEIGVPEYLASRTVDE